MGVLYKGRVYCNIRPIELAEIVWIEDFVAIGIKTVKKVAF
jgi:hypothetical protein